MLNPLKEPFEGLDVIDHVSVCPASASVMRINELIDVAEAS